ncbi:MAG TPA: DUF2071 domain-containing protein [Gemmatimonadaceae bacterium]
MAAAFLTAEWRWLAMLNYRVPRELLRPLVPRGTTLDVWHGEAYVSVVGFLFRNTRLFGLRVPLHGLFEEVNLRFYVRRDVDGEVRRGVTFIRELVPKRAVSIVARLAYNEPYRTVPMRHRLGMIGPARRPLSVEYAWRVGGEWCGMRLFPEGDAYAAEPGSEEEFITNHRWGYTRRRTGGTTEYQVRHPAWRVCRGAHGLVVGDLSTLYGRELAEVLARPPHSAYFAAGSMVAVHRPARLPRHTFARVVTAV